MNQSLLLSFKLSFQVATISTLLVVLVGTAFAYLLARRKFMGKELLDVILTLPLILPPTVIGYYLVILFGANGTIGKFLNLNIIFTWQAAVLASFVVSLPLMIKTTRSAIESVDIDLIHASHTLGHNEFTTCFRVILPLAKRGIIAGAILSFARGLGEFGATLMFAGYIPGKTDTIPLTIYSLAESGDWQQANFVVLIYTLMAGIFLYISNKLKFKVL